MTETVDSAMKSAQQGSGRGVQTPAAAPGLQSLVYRISHLAHETEGPLSLAFTGLEPGSPSRQLAQRIALELARHPEHRVLYADLQTVIAVANSGTPAAEHVTPTALPGLAQLTAGSLREAHEPTNRWHNDAGFRQRYLTALGGGFSYLLLGCPALEETHDALGLAAFLDGFVLTVQAEHTRKGDLLRAEQMILNAGGRLLGSVLNNTTDTAPDWALGKR